MYNISLSHSETFESCLLKPWNLLKTNYMNAVKWQQLVDVLECVDEMHLYAYAKHYY